MHMHQHSAPSPLHPVPHELEAAGAVQRRLLRSGRPRLRSLDYAGRCLQAGRVGGDTYDFIEPGPGRLVIAVGDVCGKGLPAALMMAALHAGLRAHYADGTGSIESVLPRLNRLLVETTAEAHYASLFLAEFDDASRRLRYANCGQVPPLLLCREGRFERLAATATPIGLFHDWSCSVAECRLRVGDTLIVYSDGVTESTNAAGQEFGEARLLESTRRLGSVPAAALADGLLARSRAFGGGRQADDMTLVAARCTSPRADEGADA